MNLLVINWQDRLNPQAGGAEIHIHEIFGRLARRGYHVHLLCSGWTGAEPETTLDGMRVTRVGSRHTFSVAAPLHYRKHLKRQSFDLTVEALNKVPVFAPLWTRSPVMLLVHHLFGTTAFSEAGPPVAALTWLLERPLPVIYKDVHVEAISYSTAEDLADRGLDRDRIRVIHPGVDPQFFTPADAARRADVPTFVYIGRLKRYKSVDTAVKAVARLRDRGQTVRLLVAGRGDYLQSLQKLTSLHGVEDRVEFLGFVSDDEKRDLFRTAWANLFPSAKEGWGITNIEAAACGTPSIASDSPGLRESVRDGETGLLVPPGDVEALADAMSRLASSRTEVERLGKAALGFARSLSWDFAADLTEQHLHEVIAASASNQRAVSRER